MATSTTNFGLTKPAYNESADVAVINTNMDTVDEVMGKNQNLAKGAQGAIAIVADGDTHVAITAGQYVYVRNNTHGLAEGLYTASSNVSANANITSSNMTAVSGGGLNALNSKLTSPTTITVTAYGTGVTINDQQVFQVGNIVFGSVRFTTSESKNSGSFVITNLPVGKTTLSAGSAFASCAVNNTSVAFAMVNSTQGRIATSTSVSAGTYVVSFIYLAA